MSSFFKSKKKVTQQVARPNINTVLPYPTVKFNLTHYTEYIEQLHVARQCLDINPPMPPNDVAFGYIEACQRIDQLVRIAQTALINDLLNRETTKPVATEEVK